MTDANPMRATRALHTIHAATDCERLRQLYCAAFGGICFSEGYYGPEDRDMALLYVADHMIEVMAPRDADDLSFTFARYVRETGASFHSVAFAVRDCKAALERCVATGVRVTSTGPGFFFVHPKSSGGIIMEITDNRMPNDPWDLPNWRRDWASGRLARPHALAHVVCAPRDPGAAVAFLVDVLGGVAQEPSTVAWPQPATATPVAVADATVLVLDPADRDNGPLAEFAKAPNSGIYALAWRLADPAGAARWFGECAIPIATIDGGHYTHEAKLDGARHWFA